MHTNGNITLYNKYLNEETRLDNWKRAVVKDVFIENRKGSNKRQTGLDTSDQLYIVIPLNYRSTDTYISPIDFKGEKGTFTLGVGDKVVIGDIDIEIKDKITDLDRQVEAFTITSVDINNYGSKHMQNIEIGAK